jgi:hypothetical protein
VGPAWHQKAIDAFFLNQYTITQNFLFSCSKQAWRISCGYCKEIEQTNLCAAPDPNKF